MQCLFQDGLLKGVWVFIQKLKVLLQSEKVFFNKQLQ